MRAYSTFTSDDLLSGHNDLHPKLLQDARRLALHSQLACWTSTDLLRELISIRGKLTLNRSLDKKWPFEIVNGRVIRDLTETQAYNALITGDLESSLQAIPAALQNGIRLSRLIEAQRAKGIGIYFKTTLKLRTQWYHDYQYHDQLAAEAMLSWIGMSSCSIKQILTSESLSRDEIILLEIVNGHRKTIASKVFIKGVESTIRHIPRSFILSPDFAFTLIPASSEGFTTATEYFSAIGAEFQKIIDTSMEITEPLLSMIPDHTRLLLMSDINTYEAVMHFKDNVTLALNRHTYAESCQLVLDVAGEKVEIICPLSLPSNVVLTSEMYESLCVRARNSTEESFNNLKKIAGSFDLGLIEKPFLLKLLRMKNRQMKKSFFPIMEKIKGSIAMADILESDPRFTHYHDLYPARNINRQWIAYLGPTNSGKTHSSMNEMAAAENGIYLSPLRLMALENQERLEQSGIPCSLVTGEEQIIREGASHYCCTVEEFARFKNRKWDVVVVDEVQMLCDQQRGWAWTDALVSAQTPRLIVTGPGAIEPTIRSLAQICGDEVDVLLKDRLTDLQIASGPEKIETIRAGSIIVAFSRKTVLDIKRMLDAKGRSTAVVYGALSPMVRKEQARLFREGEAEIMIATDAIGMGLNLPAHSVYFYADSKFDGQSVRPLTSQEVKQIGGRAGRYGLSESGTIGAFTSEALSSIRSRFKQIDRPVDLQKFQVRPTLAHLSTLSEVLGEKSLLKVWLSFIKTVNYGEAFRAVLPTELMEWIRQIDNCEIDLELRWIFACAPVHGGLDGYASQWLQEWLRCLHKSKPITLPMYSPQPGLKGYEDALHMIDAYLHLARVLPEQFFQAADAEALKTTMNDKMIDALSTRRRNSKRKPSAESTTMQC